MHYTMFLKIFSPLPPIEPTDQKQVTRNKTRTPDGELLVGGLEGRKGMNYVIETKIEKISA